MTFLKSLRQRRGMYEDMDYNDAEALSAMVSTCKPYLTAAHRERHLPGLAGVRRRTSRRRRRGPDQSRGPAIPMICECRRATILNVYVDPDFRRQGIARRLMQTMIDWCRKEGFAAVYLHASKDGRPLYETSGIRTDHRDAAEAERQQCSASIQLVQRRHIVAPSCPAAAGGHPAHPGCASA